MKKGLNLLVVLLVFLIFSCSSSKSGNDSDMRPDEDIDTQDSETQDDDSDSQDSEIVDDSDETSDADEDQDYDMFDEDWQRDIDIPEMSDDPYYEAYGDADFNVAYYYYGDKPTPSQDPENVKALWSKRCKNDSCTDYEIFDGEKIPDYTVKYDGFVNNETEAVLTKKPILRCNAIVGSKPGDYTINVSGAEAANYNITHKNGKLTILALKFIAGGETSKDEDDPATYQITSTGSNEGSIPTVAIIDDKDAGGKFEIPESVIYHDKTFTVTEIAEGAFENNKNLTDVIIPSSISGIGDKAFKGCTNLESITVYITTPINLSVAEARGTTRSDGSSIFEGVNKETCVLYVPDGSVELYKAAPVWKDFKHIVAMSITGIKVVTMSEGDECFDIYNLQGQKVKSKATDLKGLPRGIYIINGKKVAVK